MTKQTNTYKSLTQIKKAGLNIRAYDWALIENLCEVFDKGRTVEIEVPTSHRRRSELSVLDEDGVYLGAVVTA